MFKSIKGMEIQTRSEGGDTITLHIPPCPAISQAAAKLRQMAMQIESEKERELALNILGTACIAGSVAYITVKSLSAQVIPDLPTALSIIIGALKERGVYNEDNQHAMTMLSSVVQEYEHEKVATPISSNQSTPQASHQ